MNKTKLLSMALFAVVSLCISGCGHNAVTYSDGIGVDFGLKPDSLGFAFNIRYGKIFNAVVKEKTEVAMEAGFTSSTDNTAAAAAATSLDSKISIKTGDQITGYTVDLEKARREP